MTTVSVVAGLDLRALNACLRSRLQLELGPHIDNGGPTLTLALGENSVAVDAAPDCTEWDGSPATTDQRGVSRPQGPACDVGAFELEQVPPDVTPPAISITTPADGAVFTLGQAVLADFACQDEAGGSGVGGCTGTVANGAVLPTDLVGTTTFTVQTEDSAGNVSSQTHTYGVVYDFRGFSRPVRNQGFNVAKAGQAIPIKWRLLDANGEAVTTLGSATVTVQSLACSEGVTRGQLKGVLVRLWMHLAAAGKPGFQNLGNGYYQYNWKTRKDYAKSCKTLHLDLGDGITHTAKFSFAR